jgi:O-antigen/teichoic acid export membrane protein
MNPGRVLALAPLQIAQALVGLGAIAAFTRLMSAAEFGAYALALSASMFAHTVLFTWAEAAAFRFFAAARAESRLADHFATLIAMALALGGGVFVATGALLAFVGADNHIAALAAFASGAATFRFLSRISRETDRAAFDIGRFAMLETAYLIIGFTAGVALLVQYDFGAAAPFAGLMLAGVLVLVVDAPRLFARASGGVVTAQRAAMYASYGAPLATALALDLGVQMLARIILAHQAGVAELGAYAAAFGLARPLDLIFIAAGAAFSPLLLAAYVEQGRDAAREAAARLFVILAAVAIPAAVGLTLIAEPLATLVVGEALRAEAIHALPWLALAALAAGFNLYYWSEAFQLTKRTGLRALIMLAPGVVQLALTAALAATYGAVGAAIAAAAGALTGAVLLSLVGKRLVALPAPISSVLRAFAAAAFMAIMLAAAPAFDAFSLALKVITGVFAYAAAAYVFDVAGMRALIGARALRHVFQPEPAHAS